MIYYPDDKSGVNQNGYNPPNQQYQSQHFQQPQQSYYSK
jgi:hypothetical protein